MCLMWKILHHSEQNHLNHCLVCSLTTTRLRCIICDVYTAMHSKICSLNFDSIQEQRAVIVWSRGPDPNLNQCKHKSQRSLFGVGKKLSATRGANVAMGADVREDVPLWMLIRIRSNLHLPTPNLLPGPERQGQRAVECVTSSLVEWQSNFRCVTCFCLPCRLPDTLHLCGTPAWILIRLPAPPDGSCRHHLT